MSEPTKVLRSVSVTLTKEELTKIIKRYLAREGFEGANVEFKVTSRTEGHGYGEHQVLALDSCVASCRLITEVRDDA